MQSGPLLTLISSISSVMAVTRSTSDWSEAVAAARSKARVK
jgi:hypothetical protein